MCMVSHIYCALLIVYVSVHIAQTRSIESLDAGCRSCGLRICIIHIATQQAHWSVNHAESINLFYARRHGYDFFAYTCPPTTRHPYMWDPNEQIRANWAKPLFITRHLRDYHYVMLLDADAVIADPSITIEQFAKMHIVNNFVIVTPKNCMVQERGKPDTFICWDDQPGIPSLNIGAILVKNDKRALRVMSEWAHSVYTDCQQFVPPKWNKTWVANDQQCLSVLVNTRAFFSEAVNVLNAKNTYDFIGGSPSAWLTHYLGGNRDKEAIGNSILESFNRLGKHNARSPKHWIKHPNPVVGGDLGTCFDMSIIHCMYNGNQCNSSKFSMYFSWRPERAIALAHSNDGVTWSKPTIVLKGISGSDWEDDVNRPFVLALGSEFHMWYTGQFSGVASKIGYAHSIDGHNWVRHSAPVLSPSKPWEKNSIMCSFVIYDPLIKMFRMWYSAGDQIEPNAIGHSVSHDGLQWNRTHDLPIFTAESTSDWERDRVACPSVVYNGEYYYMFYIGFSNLHSAAIGIARSVNGISNWERHPDNPIIKPTSMAWDSDAVYKPYPVYDGSKWILWYNGRSGSSEQIGFAILNSHDLGF